MQKLDAEPDGGQGEEGGKFAETFQERGGACRSRTSDPALLYFMRAQASAQIKVCGEAVCRRDTRPLGPMAEGPLCALILVMKEASSMVAMPFERPGPCSAIGGGGVSEGSSPGVTVETKVHAGVVSGRKGGRRRSSTEVPVGGAMVALISWVPLSEDETRVGRDGGEGWSNWLQIFMRMSPKTLSPRHC